MSARSLYSPTHKEQCSHCISRSLESRRTFPSSEADLSTLGLQKSMRGASSAAETAICDWGSHFEKANSPPRITARRGGGVTKKMARSLLMDAGGVVFLVHRSEHHPVLAKSGCCAIFS